MSNRERAGIFIARNPDVIKKIWITNNWFMDGAPLVYYQPPGFNPDLSHTDNYNIVLQPFT